MKLHSKLLVSIRCRHLAFVYTVQLSTLIEKEKILFVFFFIIILFKCSSPIRFEAYFTANSDRSFSITPDCGELLPARLNGTLLKVSFCPTVYGRTFNGMLIVNVRRNRQCWIVSTRDFSNLIRKNLTFEMWNFHWLECSFYNE